VLPNPNTVGLGNERNNNIQARQMVCNLFPESEPYSLRALHLAIYFTILHSLTDPSAWAPRLLLKGNREATAAKLRRTSPHTRHLPDYICGSTESQEQLQTLTAKPECKQDKL